MTNIAKSYSSKVDSKRYHQAISDNRKFRISVASTTTTNAEDITIRLLSKHNSKLTTLQITSELNRGHETKISGVGTVKRRLQEADLHGRVAVRKPLLRRGNRVKRLQWTRICISRLVSGRIFVRRSRTEKIIADYIVVLCPL